MTQVPASGVNRRLRELRLRRAQRKMDRAMALGFQVLHLADDDPVTLNVLATTSGMLSGMARYYCDHQLRREFT